MFGNNVKIHFAGMEQPAFIMMMDAVKVRYMLFTVYPFICEQFGIKAFPSVPKIPQDNILRLIKMPHRKHRIMDSGLFTLMFGAQAGKRDKLFLQKWCYAIADFVKNVHYEDTLVEVDCQKILGVEEAWEFRKMLRKLLPNNRIINVFHLEDGEEGLNRLIDYTDYIAVSVPEMRINRRKQYKQIVIDLARYIKRRKSSIDIHLLGCTEHAILEHTTFCTSADSTAYQKILRYGGYGKYRRRDFKHDKLEEYKNKALELIKYPEYQWAKAEDKIFEYVKIGAWALDFDRAKLSKTCGDQT